MTHTKRWVVAPPITEQADQALVKFPPILKQIVFNRGLATDAEARAFLKAEPNANTDPFQLTGMQATVDRICYALQHNEPIAIYGDYDVDGVTATALLVDAYGGKEIKLNDRLVALGNTNTVGSSIFRDYLVPFEVVSMLLLAALVGAVVIARRD